MAQLSDTEARIVDRYLAIRDSLRDRGIDDPTVAIQIVCTADVLDSFDAETSTLEALSKIEDHLEDISSKIDPDGFSASIVGLLDEIVANTSTDD